LLTPRVLWSPRTARQFRAVDGAAPDAAIFAALERASKQLSADCKTAREKMLEDVGLQRAPAAAARAVLETLAWADGSLHHAWRLAESLRIASGK
jgi:phosphate:Na+ symporter